MPGLIAFKHSGDLGDVVYSLPAVRGHLARHGAPGDRALLLFGRHPHTREPMSAARHLQLKALLELQPYVAGCRLWCGEDAVDLDRFRLAPDRAHHWNLADLHLEALGLSSGERRRPWLAVDRPDRWPGRPVVFNRTERYRNPRFPWRAVHERYGKRAVFVGTASEHDAFCREVGAVPRVATADLLEVARLIAGCGLFVGNQSVALAIAEGLGHRLIAEVCPESPSVAFVRAGATLAFDADVEMPPVDAPPARLLFGVPTLSRADLLHRFYHDYGRWVGEGDRLVVLDNGGQRIDLPPSERLEVARPGPGNLGVPGSWNWLARHALAGGYDALVLLQDDVGVPPEWPATARRLLARHPEVDLFLSLAHGFGVQVHRPRNFLDVGMFEEGFGLAWREDDDYALRMTRAGRRYRRFPLLDLDPRSLDNATDKPTRFEDATAAFLAKWGALYPVNLGGFTGFMTNEHLTWGGL